MKNLKNMLTRLRKLSYHFEDLNEVLTTLKEARKFLRTKVLMEEDDRLFDLYDDIIDIILDIEDNQIEKVVFDGQIFNNVLTDFGFKDLTITDFSKIQEVQ